MLEKYENEIKEAFIGELKEFNDKFTDFDLEMRRKIFKYNFDTPHRTIFYKFHKQIVEDEIIWDSYDGNVKLHYKQYGFIDVQEKEFYIPEIINTLNI